MPSTGGCQCAVNIEITEKRVTAAVLLKGLLAGNSKPTPLHINGGRARDGETERQRLVLTAKQSLAKQKPRFLRSHEQQVKGKKS
ncbi:hypothetical protein C4J81_09910 [Deltaproteobacteria bacterium Smac51]|nr:hypothetical protein C4J81_09910 [Deltaproteobacteria bacterium Smac51]